MMVPGFVDNSGWNPHRDIAPILGSNFQGSIMPTHGKY
jgi:hypothetical protein